MKRIITLAMLVLFLLIISNSAVQSANLSAAQQRVFNASSKITSASLKSVKAGSKMTVTWNFSGTADSSAKIYLHQDSNPSADKLLYDCNSEQHRVGHLQRRHPDRHSSRQRLHTHCCQQPVVTQKYQRPVFRQRQRLAGDQFIFSNPRRLPMML